MTAADTTPAPDLPAPAPGPRAVWGELTKNFGQVRRAQRLEARFSVRNEGSAPLLLTQPFVLGCKCAQVKVPEPIPPGGEGALVVVVDTTDLGGRTDLKVGVATNDPADLHAALAIEFEVLMMVRAHPGYMRYLYVHGEPTGTIVQTIWALDRPDLEALEVKSPYPFLKVDLREAKEEERRPGVVGRQWRLAATLVDGAPVGALTGTVDVVTNHDTDTVLRIPVSGFVRPVYSFTPAEFDLGEVRFESGRPGRATAYYSSHTTAGLAPVAVRTTVKGIEAALKALKPPHRYEIILTLAPDLPAGPFDGKVVVETNDPKYRHIEVPLRGRVVPATSDSGASR